MSAIVPSLITLLDGQQCLVWSDGVRRRQLSSASVGGGLSDIDWVVNLQVPSDYSRYDLDDHAAEVTEAAGLSGTGVTMLTAAAVQHVTSSTEAGVRSDATVGISTPTWAAAPDSGSGDAPEPGTINIVVQLPLELSVAAAVNAVMTATEAKTQALVECGVNGTGTATDAVTITWPVSGIAARPEQFAGPRSTWGARIGRVVHAAVIDGVRAWELR